MPSLTPPQKAALREVYAKGKALPTREDWHIWWDLWVNKGLLDFKYYSFRLTPAGRRAVREMGGDDGN